MDVGLCQQCGAPLSGGGFCPACLFRLGLAETAGGFETAASRGLQFAPVGPVPRVGQSFGEYDLVRLLGRGGFGFVWEAVHQTTRRRVALKVVTEVHAATTEALARFEREGQLAASVSDPHCVFVYGVEQIAGYPVIVMELMLGGTLQDELNTRGRLPSRDAVDRILDVIDGLTAAQRVGVLHRDVKPANCFVDADGTVKIGDFGISTTLEAPQLTRTGSFLGTPVYSSPEQARGRQVDARSDIYSLGATLYALLGGRPPFSGGNAGEVLARVLSELPPPIGRDAVTLPRGLERIVRRMLAKDPARRPQDYASLRSALLPYSSSALTVATLAQRFCAYAVDGIFVGLMLDWPASLLLRRMWPAGSPAWIDPLLTPQFYYFVIAEGAWGRSVGKRLFGLRVTTAVGGPIDWWQAILRTAIFWFVPVFAAMARDALVPSGTSNLVGFLLSNIDGLVVLVTMRRGNGYAGLHELGSGTRVMSLLAQTVARVPAFTATVVSEPRAAPEFVGPYRVTATRWRSGVEVLLIARDDLLRRDVWVHQFTAGAEVESIGALVTSRAGRLRWLTGSRTPDGGWDAYEAPSGTTVIDWVEQRGPLSWGDARRVLTDVATELQARVVDAGVQARLSIGRVWVDSRGRARLLEFSAVASSDALWSFGEWRVFMHALTVWVLEARVMPDAGPSNMPRATVPEHVKPLLARICERRLGSIGELVGAFRDIAERPAEVTAARRVGPVLAAVLGGATALILTTWIVVAPQADGYSPLNSTVLLTCVGPMLLLAAIVRSNAWLALFGIALQTSDGRRAGRLRCAVRALIVWLPLLPIMRILKIHAEVGKLTYGFFIADGDWMMNIAFLLAVISLLAGAVYALVRPNLGLPDVVCGTRLVPM